MFENDMDKAILGAKQVTQKKNKYKPNPKIG